MLFEQQLQTIIDNLTNSLNDAASFDKGVDAAGRRVRQAIQTAKTDLQTLRVSIQTERNSRKESK